MYFLYVDESGDPGLPGSSHHFILSGLVIHESQWSSCLEQIIAFRKGLQSFKLRARDEIHAAEWVTGRPPIAKTNRYLRLCALRELLVFESKLEVSLLHVAINKENKTPGYAVFDQAWTTLIQRFENTIGNRNFPHATEKDFGTIIADNTHEKMLRNLLRKRRVYNPIPNSPRYNSQQSSYRNLPITYVLEDATLKNSAHSYFLQLVDANAYFLHQKYRPNAFVQKKKARDYFDLLEPVVCKYACKSNNFGVVEL